MKYTELINYYEKIEETSSRNLMTDYLVDLFRKTPVEDIDKVVYLTEGKLYPGYLGIELGMAEKMALRALSMSSGLSQDKIEIQYKKIGDIGQVSENILKTKSQTTLFNRELTVNDVYNDLDKIAKSKGPGSTEAKLRILSGLLSDANSKDAKYIMRMVTGKMRLGVADMTIIDALSQAFANGKKEEIEKIYNISSDLGDIAKSLRKCGMDCLNEYHIKVGRPVKMMLAQRMESAIEIIEKIGKPICEYKYDGIRIQIHKSGNKIKLFTRNLETITDQYPDIVNFAAQNLKADEAIVEGEGVAVDPNTGYMLPFQELMHRRRKYEIEEKAEEYPVNMYLFDALYVNKDLTDIPLKERRNILKNSINETNQFKMAHSIITDEVKEIEAFFEKAIENGCEGLVLKDEDSRYQAGARGWQWIKLKRTYQSKMLEPIDVVIVGAFMGRGRRSGSYGALLVSVYDHNRDTFPTITKIGSGFTDQDLKNFPEMLSPYIIEKKHPRVESYLNADVWFVPKIVIESIGDELTLSPIHPCAFGKIRSEAGIAMRFPRYTHNLRSDKSPEDATDVSEIIDMYKSQLKKISQK